MQPDEIVGWGDLAGEVVARGADHVEDVHRALARRTFGLVSGTEGRSVPQWAHDTISRSVYAAVRHGGRVAGRVGGRLVAAVRSADAPHGPQSPAAATAQATVVGLIGDELAASGNPVAWPVRLRRDGRDVPVAPRPVRGAWPEATGRVLVQLPGLFESEHAWTFGAKRWWDPPDLTHADRLATTQGWTPVDVRYPSGASLAANGAELAHLLRRLLDVWPVPVEELAILGHSMGGLVARHALRVGHREEHAWVEPCRHVVCLGSPHGGSPVARLAAGAARWLGRVPETTGIADILDRRSVGIRELEHTDPVPAVPGVDVHVVAAVAFDRPGRLVREVVGDGLVGASSATGLAADGSRVPCASTRTFPGLHHFELLNHPDVYAHLHDLLGRPLDGRTPVESHQRP